MGHKLIQPVAAVNAVIFNSAREILLTLRSQKIREPGKWCLPGGHLDGGETWAQAMRREVKEEIGLTVLSEELLGIYSDPMLTVTEKPNSEGVYTQYLVVTFLVTHFEGSLTANEEVDEIRWFSLATFPKEKMIRSHPIRVEDAYRFSGDVFVR